jgi:formylglycine-generating enzyme required for sulfatase activity
MMWIERGKFTMGTTEEQKEFMVNREVWEDWMERELPAHQVAITKGFWLGKYELTQGQWESVMGTRPWSGEDYVVDNPNHPAVYIFWEDVQDLISRLNQAEGSEVYRLPTEAEWEYACRAGTNTRWSFGDDESQLGAHAWYNANAWDVGEPYAHEVGTKLANPWGVHDMHGNVWEWCQDWFVPYESASQADPVILVSCCRHVVRGGYFGSLDEYTRSATRHRDSRPFNLDSIGLRLVRQEL